MITRRRARPALGTIVDVAVEAATAADAERAVALAFDEIEAMEAVFSVHRAGSEAALLATHAHLAPTSISDAMRAVLDTALELHRASGGIFDIAVGGTLAARGLLPPLPGRGFERRAHGSSADIHIRPDGRVSFLRALRLDFGGIAKGYAIDRAVDVLLVHGVASGCVNAGGDLRVFGAQRAPVALRFRDGLRVVAQLHDGAFAASRITGNDHAARVWASLPGAHLDARSGEPVMHQDSVAVFAPRAMIADALTKVALVCPQTADRLCPKYSAQWRCFPFQLVHHHAA